MEHGERACSWLRWWSRASYLLPALKSLEDPDALDRALGAGHHHFVSHDLALDDMRLVTRLVLDESDLVVALHSGHGLLFLSVREQVFEGLSYCEALLVDGDYRNVHLNAEGFPFSCDVARGDTCELQAYALVCSLPSLSGTPRNSHCESVSIYQQVPTLLLCPCYLPFKIKLFQSS